MELAHVFQDVVVLPAMVTLRGVRDDRCGVPHAPDSRFIGGDVGPLDAASPARPAGGGGPAEEKSLLVQMSPSGSVAQASLSPTSPALRSTPDVSPSSGVAAMDQYLPWNGSPPVGESADSPLLPAPLTPRRMAAGQVASGSGVSSQTGETDVAGGHRECHICLRRAPLMFFTQ